MSEDSKPTVPGGWQMFALSFTALFLEMLVIRWVPSVVHLVAYYANLMLLSSFLGLAAGALAAGRRWDLFGFFPVFLALDIWMLLSDRNTVVGTSSSEAHFYALPTSMFHAYVLVRIFGMNALVFAPLGQRMGALFNAMPRLTAYGWDLAGSLCGTLGFGLFSLNLFSPVAGMAGVAAVYLLISPRRSWWISAPLFAAVLAALAWRADPRAVWSPYYYVTVSRFETPTVSEAEPPRDLLTMRDPPAYIVRVNQFGYHADQALDPARYTPGSAAQEAARGALRQYLVPYAITSRPDRVLVVGAGGGCDVEAALASGARHVDAVEIDPGIVALSRRFNAGAPYSDPRVSVHVDDARSYLAKAAPGYDLVLFGFLDSQALFSSMNNVRLDGYVYTVESLRTAYGLVGPHGMLVLSFGLARPWLGPKLFELMEAATGRRPTLYTDPAQGLVILCAPKDPARLLPSNALGYRSTAYTDPPRLELPTDDWPFLYLLGKTIPSDYLVPMAGLLAFSLAAVGFLRGRSFGVGDVHFGLLGMGFLLLETKSIGDCTLFFGATWLVTLIVVAGVLLMVMAANLVAGRLRTYSLALYAPLFAVLALLLLVPRELILGLGLADRVLWAVLVVPLPIFFAGVIFSTTFREASRPSAAFGANLIGAMVGGFCEYLVMAVGNRQLSVLVMVAYLGSLLALGSARRAGRTL